MDKRKDNKRPVKWPEPKEKKRHVISLTKTGREFFNAVGRADLIERLAREPDSITVYKSPTK